MAVSRFGYASLTHGRTPTRSDGYGERVISRADCGFALNSALGIARSLPRTARQSGFVDSVVFLEWKLTTYAAGDSVWMRPRRLRAPEET